MIDTATLTAFLGDPATQGMTAAVIGDVLQCIQDAIESGMDVDPLYLSVLRNACAVERLWQIVHHKPGFVGEKLTLLLGSKSIKLICQILCNYSVFLNQHERAALLHTVLTHTSTLESIVRNENKIYCVDALLFRLYHGIDGRVSDTDRTKLIRLYCRLLLAHNEADSFDWMVLIGLALLRCPETQNLVLEQAFLHSEKAFGSTLAIIDEGEVDGSRRHLQCSIVKLCLHPQRNEARCQDALNWLSDTLSADDISSNAVQTTFATTLVELLDPSRKSGIMSHILRLLSNICGNDTSGSFCDLFGQQGGLPLVLACTRIDDIHMYNREWAILALRYLSARSESNRDRIRELQPRHVVKDGIVDQILQKSA